MKLFVLYDNAVQSFADPISLRHVNEAKRAFLAELRNPKSKMYEFPEDYILYECGEFINNSGEFITPDQPIKIISGVDLIRSDEKSTRTNEEAKNNEQ